MQHPRGAQKMLVKGASNLLAACLLSHFDQNSSGLGRAVHFTRKRNASAAHALACFEPHLKSQAINRRHHRLLSFNPSESTGQQNQRICMIGIHVPDDPVCAVDERARLGLLIL
jgi:hypothetical protein